MILMNDSLSQIKSLHCSCDGADRANNSSGNGACAFKYPHTYGVVNGQFDDSPDDDFSDFAFDCNGHRENLFPGQENIYSHYLVYAGHPEQNRYCAGEGGSHDLDHSVHPQQETISSGECGTFLSSLSYLSGNDALLPLPGNSLIQESGKYRTEVDTQNRMVETPSQATMGIIHPTNRDVLCGRGGKTNNHNGNREFRLLVDLYRQIYVTVPKPRKARISQTVVAAVRARGGRFLKTDETGTWYDIGNAKAVAKTSQALREGAAKALRDILSNTDRFATSVLSQSAPSSIVITRKRSLSVKEPVATKNESECSQHKRLRLFPSGL